LTCPVAGNGAVEGVPLADGAAVAASVGGPAVWSVDGPAGELAATPDSTTRTTAPTTRTPTPAPRLALVRPNVLDCTDTLGYVPHMGTKYSR
jgi:hypothetical protein